MRLAKDTPDGMRRNKKRLIVHSHSKSDSNEYEVHVCITSILDGNSRSLREKRESLPSFSNDSGKMSVLESSEIGQPFISIRRVQKEA